VKLPSYADLLRFCELEGWEDKDKRSRKSKGDHHRYMITLSNGEQLYTRISHGSGQINDANLWRNILKQQLRVTERQFWDCVDKRKLPSRPEPEEAVPPEGIPAQLVWNLIKKAGLPEKQVAAMSKQQAIAVWNRYISSPPKRSH